MTMGKKDNSKPLSLDMCVKAMHEAAESNSNAASEVRAACVALWDVIAEMSADEQIDDSVYREVITDAYSACDLADSALTETKTAAAGDFVNCPGLFDMRNDVNRSAHMVNESARAVVKLADSIGSLESSSSVRRLRMLRVKTVSLTLH